jgi:hypothetical protein
MRGGKRKGEEEKKRLLLCKKKKKKKKKLEEVEAMVNYSAPDRRPRKLYPGVRTGAAVLWYSLTGALRDIFGPHSVAEVGGSPDTGACMSTKTVISFTLFPSSYFFFQPFTLLASLYYTIKQPRELG